MHDVMPQIDAPAREFYDFEADPELELGQHRRVADWGADDLFHHAPRRRSLKAHAARERRLSGPMPVRRFEPSPGPVDESPVPAAQAAPVIEAVAERAPGFTPEPVPQGRRTVTITGRPGLAASAERRRPSRTVEERIAHRPDRVAGWAFGMGMLLILIAVSTADAAPL